MKPWNRIDTMRADAPELARYGRYSVGVRTVPLLNPQQIDVMQLDPASPKPAQWPRSDRRLTLELWYPAKAKAPTEINAAAPVQTHFQALLRDGKTTATLHGQAQRDASPLPATHPAFPLVIVSHGFPGNRYLLSPLAENLASKGYVVAAIDHTDSTYDELNHRSFASTLVNRPLDQRFVLQALAQLNQDRDSFLYQQLNCDQCAIVGYSMGAYGALISAGAGVTAHAVQSSEAPLHVPHGLLGLHQGAKPLEPGTLDTRIKTIIPIAPWGMTRAVFDASGLGQIKLPVLFIAGSKDDVSGYETGVRAMWQAARGCTRTLLTFENAGHNAGGPMPPPLEAGAVDPKTGATMAHHYMDAVWDNVRMNNITQHFVTAWLGKHLQCDPAMDAYLGYDHPAPEHWRGFAQGNAKGLRLEHLEACVNPNNSTAAELVEAPSTH